jgi:hypothetical protein
MSLAPSVASAIATQHTAVAVEQSL